MREYVRTWINEWDLRRLDPSYIPEIEVTTVAPSYEEDIDLQRESPDDDGGERGRGVDGSAPSPPIADV